MEKKNEVSVVESTVVEPAIIEPEKVPGVDWDGLSRFTKSLSQVIKEAYYAGLEAGKNCPKYAAGSAPQRINGTNAEFFCAVADDKAYAVYTSEEKIRNQSEYWNTKTVVTKDFGKGRYDEALAWATAEVSRLSGVPMQQIPPLPSVNYRRKVK